MTSRRPQVRILRRAPCPHRSAARTSGCQPEKGGSIPPEGASARWSSGEVARHLALNQGIAGSSPACSTPLHTDGRAGGCGLPLTPDAGLRPCTAALFRRAHTGICPAIPFMRGRGSPRAVPSCPGPDAVGYLGTAGSNLAPLSRGNRRQLTRPGFSTRRSAASPALPRHTPATDRGATGRRPRVIGRPENTPWPGFVRQQWRFRRLGPDGVGYRYGRSGRGFESRHALRV